MVKNSDEELEETKDRWVEKMIITSMKIIITSMKMIIILMKMIITSIKKIIILMKMAVMWIMMATVIIRSNYNPGVRGSWQRKTWRLER